MNDPTGEAAPAWESLCSPATRALIWPYGCWLAGILLLFVPHSFDFPAWVYAGKTVLCLGLLVWFRPWRFVPFERVRGDLAAGILLGLTVYVLWVLPEVLPWPAWVRAYQCWAMMMPGSLPDSSASWCYAWQSSPMLALIKLVGSAFVIAPIEEFFFRGWLMRWLTCKNWQRLPLEHVSRRAFWLTALFFAAEHDRIVVGLLAGLVYGALAVRSGSLRAPIVAHITTNLILGLHVLFLDAYGFW